jgi:hypothetical protein
VSAVAQPDEEAPYSVRAAFHRCLAGSTDVRQVEAYVAANAAGSKGPMVAVIIKALFDLCRSAAGTFVLIVIGEIAYGIGLGWLSLRLRRWARDPRVEITLSLLTPYAHHDAPAARPC